MRAARSWLPSNDRPDKRPHNRRIQSWILRPSASVFHSQLDIHLTARSGARAPQSLTIPPPAADGHGFDAIVGQDSAIGALRRALCGARLPHALLFTGPPGVGKATCAGVVTQALNCTEQGPGDACGTCVSCRKVERGLHPDVMWMAPEPRTVGIKAVRQAVSATGYRPYEGNHRVVVVDDAHTLTTEAQNAFLKTLEEPPSSSTIVLVTSAPGSLLATVRSRCQSLRFSPLPQPLVRAYLSEKRGLDPDEARLRAALAPGSIGRAMAVDLEGYAALLEAMVEALRLAQVGGAGVIAAAESLSSIGTGETATQRAVSTLLVGRDILRDLLVVAAGGDRSSLVNADRFDAWSEWAKDVDPDAAARALESLNHGIDRLTTGIQPNVKLSLEHTLISVGDQLRGRQVPAS